MKRLQTAWDVLSMRKAKKRRRRGLAGQYARRQAERVIRKGVIAFRRWTARMGWARQQTARRLGIAPSTLAGWERDWAMDRMAITLIGRPAQQVEPDVRNIIVAAFQLMGPGVSIATLQDIFPEASRGELVDLSFRYKRLYRKGCRALIYALRWMLPGAVWAMDWLQPEEPVDGIFKFVLAVRDLASGHILLTLPAQTKDAGTCAAALEALFKQHGPPLVIKSDNELDAAEITAVLKRNSVFQLLSPPGLPQYNGACEAGIGALKTRAHHESVRHDRPGEWTCDDVEAARLMANQTHKPWGHLNPTPEQAWLARQPICLQTCQAFATTVREFVPQARQDRGILPAFDWDLLSRWDQAAVMRIAISRALVEHDLLRFRRTRITPPILTQRTAGVS